MHMSASQVMALQYKSWSDTMQAREMGCVRLVLSSSFLVQLFRNCVQSWSYSVLLVQRVMQLRLCCHVQPLLSPRLCRSWLSCTSSTQTAARRPQVMHKPSPLSDAPFFSLFSWGGTGLHYMNSTQETTRAISGLSEDEQQETQVTCSFLLQVLRLGLAPLPFDDQQAVLMAHGNS